MLFQSLEVFLSIDDCKRNFEVLRVSWVSGGAPFLFLLIFKMFLKNCSVYTVRSNTLLWLIIEIFFAPYTLFFVTDHLVLIAWVVIHPASLPVVISRIVTLGSVPLKCPLHFLKLCRLCKEFSVVIFFCLPLYLFHSITFLSQG